MTKRGWHGQSARHSLAARGLKSIYCPHKSSSVRRGASLSSQPVTRLSYEDLEYAFEGDDVMLKLIKNVTSGDLKHIARKMGDDYIEQMFWDSLQYRAEDYLKEKYGK